MPDKIIIPFDDRTEKDIEDVGVVTSIGFDRLRKVLHTICDCKPTEKIAGLVIDKSGITIKIETSKTAL
jgi:hypothetical protein